MNAKFLRNGIVMLVLVVGTVALLYTWLIQSPEPNSQSYTKFLNDVTAGKVAKVVQQDTLLTVTTNGTPPDTYTTDVATPSSTSARTSRTRPRRAASTTPRSTSSRSRRPTHPGSA